MSNTVQLRDVAKGLGISYKTASNRCKKDGVNMFYMAIGDKQRNVVHIEKSDINKISQHNPKSKYDNWIIGCKLAEQLDVTSNKIAYIAKSLGIKNVNRKISENYHIQTRLYPPESKALIVKAVKEDKSGSHQYERVQGKLNSSTENRQAGYYQRIGSVNMINSFQG